MKKLLLPLCILLLTISGCKKDKCEQMMSYWKYSPRFMKIDDLVKQVKTGPATPLRNVGKIYLSGHFIFVNEVKQGIHVIDNSNPSAPQNVAFINIPGNIDMAVKDNILYADCYIALLSLNISNPSNPTLVSSVNDALPPLYSTYADPSQGIVVGYDSTRVTEKTNIGCGGQGGYPYMLEDKQTNGGVYTANTTPTASVPSSPNVGGSMARFAVNNNILYIVDQSTLRVFNITNASAPIASGSTQLGWNIETIFPYNNHLFIGTSIGMQIFNLNNPLSPQHDATFSHALSCDPVAVSGDYAYVTLHSGTTCNSTLNQLQVVNISNTTNPTLVATYDMYSPRGVGIDGHTLFICDGGQGLKVFDASDPSTVSSHALGTFSNIQSQDVIPFNKNLIMIGENGLYEYDYSDPQHITSLGYIPVSK
ncbi:MAG: hypothetical protein JWO03_3326 [Bacteroidetes bacterium]|nr:hypothetical protein [Bacteroidota bacterium]